MKLNAEQRKRLANLSAPRSALPGQQLGGVLLIPKILPFDEWGQIAQASQAELVRATREGIDRESGVD